MSVSAPLDRPLSPGNIVPRTHQRCLGSKQFSLDTYNDDLLMVGHSRFIALRPRRGFRPWGSSGRRSGHFTAIAAHIQEGDQGGRDG